MWVPTVLTQFFRVHALYGHTIHNQRLLDKLRLSLIYSRLQTQLALNQLIISNDRLLVIPSILLEQPVHVLLDCVVRAIRRRLTLLAPVKSVNTWCTRFPGSRGAHHVTLWRRVHSIDFAIHVVQRWIIAI